MKTSADCKKSLLIGKNKQKVHREVNWRIQTNIRESTE